VFSGIPNIFVIAGGCDKLLPPLPTAIARGRWLPDPRNRKVPGFLITRTELKRA
jgi:hypothetical protein